MGGFAVEHTNAKTCAKGPQQHRSGATLLETALLMTGVLGLLVYIADLARETHLRSTVSYELSLAIKRAQANRALLHDAWSSNSAADLAKFKAARSALFDGVTQSASKGILGGMRFVPVRHADILPGGRIEYSAPSPIAYLPPGYSALLIDKDGKSASIQNRHRCLSPQGLVSTNPTTDIDIVQAGSTGIRCDGPKKVDPANPKQTLKELSKEFPTGAVATYEITSLFGTTRRAEIRIAGYTNNELPFTARPTITPTPTPTATATPTPAPTATATRAPGGSNGVCYVVHRESVGSGKVVSGNYPKCVEGVLAQYGLDTNANTTWALFGGDPRDGRVLKHFSKKVVSNPEYDARCDRSSGQFKGIPVWYRENCDNDGNCSRTMLFEPPIRNNPSPPQNWVVEDGMTKRTREEPPKKKYLECVGGTMGDDKDPEDRTRGPFDSCSRDRGNPLTTCDANKDDKVFFNEQCQPVSEPQCKSIAGEFKVKAEFDSPIALVWNGSSADLSAPSLLSFPFIRSAGKVFRWYGSADLPLLAVDRNGDGVITDSTELFGTDSFGASWQHGYPALATLDTNKDMVVSDTELAGLLLWFDNNRDAVSTPDELVSAVTAGVDALWYAPDATQPREHMLFATQGFRRKLADGTMVEGASVDWFSRGFSSIAAAISAELDDTKVSARQNRERNTEDQSPLRAEPKPEALAGEVTKRTALTGSWVWKYAGDGRVNGGASGVLVLNERANGALDGLSIVEHEINALPGGSTRMASAAPLLQAYVENQKIRFIINKEAGSTATEATLSADGRSLLGTSFLTLEGSEDQVAYRWTAEKIAK